MKEQAFRADAREAKGLHEGSITRVVRVVEQQPCQVDCADGSRMWIEPYCIPEGAGAGEWSYPDDDCEPGLVVSHPSPFGVPGDRLRSVCEPTDPCKHPGCLSHVTHVCEGCGRGHAGILLDVTDVRVLRAQEVTGQDMRAAGMTFGCRWCTAPGACAVREVCEHPRDEFREFVGRAVFDANRWLWLGTVQKVEA